MLWSALPFLRVTRPRREAYFSAQSHPASPHPRVPGQDEVPGWTASPGSAANQGTGSAGALGQEEVASHPGRDGPVPEARIRLRVASPPPARGLPPDHPSRPSSSERLLSGVSARPQRWRGGSARDHSHAQGGEGGSPEPHQENRPRVVSRAAAGTEIVRSGRNREARLSRTPGPSGAELRSGSRAWLRNRIGGLFVGLIRVYQVVGAPLFGGACRFYPSCSEYARAAIARDGPWRGGLSAAGRLARCTPLQRGGLDLP